MTPEQARQAASVLTAFTEGKKIESRFANSLSAWREDASPRFDFDTFDYRVKPEPREFDVYLRNDGTVYDCRTPDNDIIAGMTRIRVREVTDDQP